MLESLRGSVPSGDRRSRGYGLARSAARPVSRQKGELTAILKQMSKLSAEERPVIGQLANEVRSELENEIESRKSALAARLQEAKLRAETLDVTMPGKEISSARSTL